MSTSFLLFFLLLFYSVLPPLSLFFALKMIYQDKNKYGMHLYYILKYLISFSFLPLLFFPELKLGLIPQHAVSLVFLLLTFLLAILGLHQAIKEKVVFFYNAGVSAAFGEEILYRSVIFALSLALWQNSWVAFAVSSFLFGTWHLKNYYWSGGKSSRIQFLYTAFIYGPIFALMRLWTGDIYLAVFFHYLTDATCALAPNWMRGWLVRGGRGKNYEDKYLTLL